MSKGSILQHFASIFGKLWHTCPAGLSTEDPTFERYAEAREADQALISRASRWLPDLFRVQTGLVSHARQLGLIAFDLLPGVRSRFAGKAMGFANGL